MAGHAVILFAHGARDARWSMTLVELQERMQARRPNAHVGIAFLEFQPPELGAEIERAIGAGARPRLTLP